MTCTYCQASATEVLVRGPAEFESVVERIRAAIADEVLAYVAFEEDPAVAVEPSFLTLDLAGPWPDVMRYHFACPRCGQRFELTAETFHGARGKWRAVGFRSVGCPWLGDH